MVQILKRNKNQKTKLKASVFLLMFTMMSVISLMPILNTNTPIIPLEETEEVEDVPIKEITTELHISEVSVAPWWNGSFLYRKLINITNPSPEILVNHTVSIEINYSALEDEGKMNESLKDVRIVENNIEKKFFVKKDFPVQGNATIWFVINVSASTTDQDTFMYYGNNSVGFGSMLQSENPAGVLWYDFEEGTGFKALDSLGNYNASFGVTPTYSPGQVGSYSLQFDGTTDYLYIEDLFYDEPDQLYQLTATCWFKTSFSGSANYYDNWAFLDFDRSEYFNFYIRGDSGLVSFSTTPTSGGQDDFDGTTDYTDDAWHFAAIVYDGIDKYIYVDPDARNPEVKGYDGTGTAHPGEYLGGPSDLARYGFIADGSEADAENGVRNNFNFEGRLDEIRYFETALSNNEIYNIYKNYYASAMLNEEQIQKAQVTFIAKDVDGRIVPNAEISLYNDTGAGLVHIETKNTTSDGSVIFTNLDYSDYNVTVNYTLSSGLEAMVLNTTDWQTYRISTFTLTGLYHTWDLPLNMCSIDFEIVDWDKYAVNYGYVNVSDTSGSAVLESLPLDPNGEATFRWLNKSSYYYKLYYKNDDYNPVTTLLNQSDINRVSYMANDKEYSQRIKVNETAIAGAGTYQVIEYFYSNGSMTELSNKKILKANITLLNMDNYLDSVKIYYVDKDGGIFSGVADDHLIFENSSYRITDKSDLIQLDMRNPIRTASQLVTDDYEVYGIYIDVQGYNTTLCNGTITIDTIETLNVYNKTALAKIHIKVLDVTTFKPVPSVIVHVINGTVATGKSVVNLTTDASGMAYGKKNSDIGMWYLRKYPYNFTLEYFGQKNKPFSLNSTDPIQWMPVGNPTIYNYTLAQNSSIVFNLVMDPSKYITNFTESTGDTSATWGDTISYYVNFSSSTNGAAGPWTPITDADEVLCTVKDFDGIPVYSIAMTESPNGNYSIEFNSNVVSAGSSYVQYTVEITGYKENYGIPKAKTYNLKVFAVNTQMSLYNYSNTAQSIQNVTQYYNELINITVSYYISGSPTSRLGDASLDYSWDYGSGSSIGEDILYDNFYSVEVNTSTAPTTATYGIDITINLENYTTGQITVYMIILPRTTKINELHLTTPATTSLLHISKDVWIEDAYNFTFVYNDTTLSNNVRIADLETANYYWYKLDVNGTPITDPSHNIDLYMYNTSIYSLDFNTETLDIGDYAIFVTFQKNNYEVRNAFIDLTIKKRTIGYSLNATSLVGTQVSIVKGVQVIITLDLTDQSRDGTALIGAKINLTIGLFEYEFTDNGDGTYTLLFNTTGIDAFFMPSTFTGTINITIENYVSLEMPLTIVVGMDEIFPGVPLFWFVLIVGMSAIFIGGYGTMKYIAYKRIPEFIKKVTKMRKSIKSGKSVPAGLVSETKTEYMLKTIGDKWRDIGLSLENIVGYKPAKKLAEIKGEPEMPEERGGVD